MVTNTLSISEKPTLKYPKSVAFIISNEFCERFNYYGMRTILVLYLTRKLGYNDNTATVLYHVFTSLVYFFPLIGAIIADSWLGRFKTILYLSIVYSIGTIIIAIGAIPTLYLPADTVTVIGLFFIALGTGGIKPCVSAFGGDQFKMPEQLKQLAMFFSLFYFTINAGSLLSTSITPILREDVHCFNEHDCFSLAFGVPAALMLLSIIIFIFGRPLYTIKKPVGNMIVSVFKCITEALKKRSKHDLPKKDHWLDYAEAKYGKQLVGDTKALLKILVLYLPLPIFWALFDQQGSRWTFQATRMVGDVGGITIKPDQMQVINPLLILLFIPLFDYYIYPILEKVGIKRPLQKLTLGGLLAAFAFVLSGLVELSLEQTDPVLPNSNQAQLRIYNGLACDYNFISSLPHHMNFTVQGREVYEEKYFTVNNTKFHYYEATAINKNGNPVCTNLNGQFMLKPGVATSYFISRDDDKAGIWEFKDAPQKPRKGYPMIRLLASLDDVYSFTLKRLDSNITVLTNRTDLLELPAAGHYEIFIDSKFFRRIEFKLGGVYVLMLDGSKADGFEITLYTLTEPNSVHMLWQLPQYIVITAGEVMFSVTGLEFSFSQAPVSMKSVLQACWLLAVAFGNLIVVLIAEFTIFELQSAEFFLFAALMVVDMGIFILLAIQYKYVEVHNDDDIQSGDGSNNVEGGNKNTPKSFKNDSKVQSQIEMKGRVNENYRED